MGLLSDAPTSPLGGDDGEEEAGAAPAATSNEDSRQGAAGAPSPPQPPPLPPVARSQPRVQQPQLRAFGDLLDQSDWRRRDEPPK